MVKLRFEPSHTPGAQAYERGLSHRFWESHFWLHLHWPVSLSSQQIGKVSPRSDTSQSQDMGCQEGDQLECDLTTWLAEGMSCDREKPLAAEGGLLGCVPPISATALLWTFGPVACSLWVSVPSSLIYLILSLEDPRRGCKPYRVYSKCGLYEFMNYDSQVPVIWWSQHLISINIWGLPNLHIYQTYSQMWRGCRTSIYSLNLSRATPKSLVNLHVANPANKWMAVPWGELWYDKNTMYYIWYLYYTINSIVYYTIYLYYVIV